MLKPMLARGELHCIGATTLDEYRKYIEKDAALERRFQPVMVEEPSEKETVAILKGLKDKYEEHHQVTITPDAIEAAVDKVLADGWRTADIAKPGERVIGTLEMGMRIREKIEQV